MLKHRLRGQPRLCPHCGPSSTLTRLRRKKLVVDILQCNACRLIFRWPQDTPDELDVHYESEFAEEAPQVLLPAPDELQKLLAVDFAPLFGDLSRKIDVLQTLRPRGRVLDYGCSWGYATYLLKKRGYDVTGFEVSRSRSAYGRKNLGVPILDSLEELEALPSASFDVIYSNHVLEHIPSIAGALALCARLLRDDGVAFHILPNFISEAAGSSLRLDWIGEDHPIAPTVEFFERALPQAGLQSFQFASSPFNGDLAAAIGDRTAKRPPLVGDELLVVARKTVPIPAAATISATQ
jgi:SAM-dependent methyltransferase